MMHTHTAPHTLSRAPHVPATWAGMDFATRLIAARALMATGATADEAARSLQTTSSAIVGFCFRNKIRIAAQFPVRSRAFQPAPEVAPETWTPLHKPVASTSRKQCCWPVGEETGAKQMFCGGHRSRGSYCEAHAKVAFAPSAGRVEYVEKLMGPGRPVEPGISVEDAVSLVVGKVKAEAGE